MFAWLHLAFNFKRKPSVKDYRLLQVKGRRHTVHRLPKKWQCLRNCSRYRGYLLCLWPLIRSGICRIESRHFRRSWFFSHLHCYLSLSQLLKLDFKLLDTACIVFVLLSYTAKIWLHVHVSCYRIKSINGRSTDRLAVVNTWIFTRHRSRYYYFSLYPSYLLLLPLL